ncbi:hypothetical protein [Hyalangium sp.]|uniref:hypothetical protein n=1 Tax=Hyalangium sp. TaxID=2028555 RepID=UPI00389A4D91
MKDGGYVVHASTDHIASGLYLYRNPTSPNTSGLTKAEELKSENLSYGRLACFAQTLEL